MEGVFIGFFGGGGSRCEYWFLGVGREVFRVVVKIGFWSFKWLFRFFLRKDWILFFKDDRFLFYCFFRFLKS